MNFLACERLKKFRRCVASPIMMIFLDSSKAAFANERVGMSKPGSSSVLA